ncbi:MAG: hypothetical protein JWO51_2437 [Rhodospirillales bacterium]|nr:hypothetical protein [Rhodospirillales bacterium]
MAGILGGGAKASTKPAYTGLQLQTSANGLAIPIVYGQAKLAPNLVWYGDFAAIKHKQSQGGKGGNASSATYTYQAAVVLALCEGPISGIANVWSNKTLTTLGALGMSFYGGTATQAPWGYLTSHHPDQALAYPSTAYVAVAPYDLGSSAGLPNHNFEVKASLWKTGAGSLFDADPSQMVLDFLTNPQYGLGFPAANIDLVSLQTGPASYQAYCQATGLWLSAALVNQEAARSTLARWLQITNSAAFWSGDTLKIVPYGDTAVSANGYSYTPDVTPIYDLDDDDYVGSNGADPVIVTRKDSADCKNWVKLEILDRENGYVTDPIEAKDQAKIDLEGALPANQITAHEICDPLVGSIAAQLILQRSVYIRNSYQFTLGWEYCLLEPMDIVTLTDVRLGMTRLPVRITSIAEDNQGNLTVTAEEFPAGIATATEYPKQTRTAFAANYDVAPGSVNTPVIFEPASDLAMNVPQVWVAASGGANWGGCSVHLSVDGATYSRIGQVTLPARLGVLTAPIGAVADPDTSSTLSISLAETPGATLVSGTQADADAHRTLIYVDGELMAYETATLTGVGQYALSYLRRGLYGTAVAAHAAGTPFARLDGNLFEYDLPAAYVGQTIYLKLTSFNIYGAAEEDLSTVPAYSYVPTGKGGYVAPPTNLLLSSANRLAADGTAISTLIAAWTASPGPLLAGYELDYRIHTAGGSNPWISVQIGQGATSWTLTPAVEGAVYDVQVRAISGLTPPTYSSFATPAASSAVLYDQTIPAVPTGLQAAASYPTVNVLWQASPSPSVAQYELKAAQGAGATIAGAATLYKGPATQFLHGGFTAGAIWTYWVAAISRAGNESAFSPGVTVNTPLGYNPSGILANSISESQLVAALQTKVDLTGLITASASTAGSVAQIAQLAGQTIGDMALKADSDVKTAIDAAATGVLWLSGQLSKLSSAFQSAGFVVNPTTGALVYNAVNQVVGTTSALITGVQAQLNAANASILLKADAATVSSQLAAVIAGNQPTLSDLFQNSAGSWAMTGGGLTVNPASITTLSTGATSLLTKTGLSIAGATYNQVVMVVRRKDAGTDWTGALQWSTAGHGFSSANQAATPVPTGFGSFQTIAWDLSANADWTGGTVTGLQFALSTAAGDSFEIQSIQVSKNVVQQLLLSGLSGQIASAQVAISGLQASVAQAASLTTVSSQGVQISTLNSEVNALTGQITLKANQTDLTNLQTALTGAQLQIDSLSGQITQNITSVTVPGAEQAAAATLAALVDQGKQALAFTGAIASARQQVQAYIANQTAAEAAQRLSLSTQVNANGAAITTEALARASADAAAASLIANLTATVNATSASISASLATEQSARASGDAANAQSILNLAATVTANSTSQSASLTTEQSARVAGDTANANSITTLSATVNGNYAALSSSISAVATQSGATAAEVTTLSAAVGGNSSAISTQATAIAGLSANYTIQTQVATGAGQRYITGIGLSAGAGGLSQIVLLANDVLIAGLNSDGSLNPVSPFEVVGGQVLMNKAVIGTITADQISANTTYTGDLSIGNGQLKLHGADDGNGNGPYFIAHDANNVTRALIGRFGNDWGIWTWNGAGTSILAASSLGVSSVGTSNLAANAASVMSSAQSNAHQSIPADGAWHDIQTLTVTIVSGASGVALTYSAGLNDTYLAAPDPGGGYGGGSN